MVVECDAVGAVDALGEDADGLESEITVVVSGRDRAAEQRQDEQGQSDVGSRRVSIVCTSALRSELFVAGVPGRPAGRGPADAETRYPLHERRED